MKKFKEIFFVLCVLAVAVSVIAFVNDRTSSRSSRELAKRMAELSPRGGPPETIDGLRQAIALYEDQIERHVKDAAQTGVYYKILATRLADRKLHNDALEALEKAIYYNTEDPLLFYLTGVSAGSAAKSIVGFSMDADVKREHFYDLAEKSYLRALELDITYTRAMYGLAVLYSFELDRPQDAIVQLERYLLINSSDTSAMFVLARSYFMIEDLTRASEIYQRIADRTRDKSIRDQALELRDQIQGMIYD